MTSDASTDSWHHVALPQPLESGGRFACEIAGHEILVFRVKDRYFATSTRCTHSAWPLTEEPTAGYEILCSLHGARFDMRDGCPTAGPARRPLTTYPIELRDGELYVSLSE